MNDDNYSYENLGRVSSLPPALVPPEHPSLPPNVNTFPMLSNPQSLHVPRIQPDKSNVKIVSEEELDDELRSLGMYTTHELEAMYGDS